MTATKRMNARAKILSYLENQGRKNKAACNEEIAIGARLKEKSVGPMVAKLVREGVVVEVEGYHSTRGGGRQRVVMAPAWAKEHQRATLPVKPKPIPRKDVEFVANVLEEAANLVVTFDFDAVNIAEHYDMLLGRVEMLRRARDFWRDLKAGRPVMQAGLPKPEKEA